MSSTGCCRSELDALEDLAADRGITPLSAFMDPGDEDFDAGLDFDLGEAGPDEGEWFAAAEGLRSVRSLLAVLADPPSHEALSDAETVVNDLEELARCLEAAARRSAKFRLSIG